MMDRSILKAARDAHAHAEGALEALEIAKANQALIDKLLADGRIDKAAHAQMSREAEGKGLLTAAVRKRAKAGEGEVEKARRLVYPRDRRRASAARRALRLTAALKPTPTPKIRVRKSDALLIAGTALDVIEKARALVEKRSARRIGGGHKVSRRQWRNNRVLGARRASNFEQRITRGSLKRQGSGRGKGGHAQDYYRQRRYARLFG